MQVSLSVNNQLEKEMQVFGDNDPASKVANPILKTSGAVKPFEAFSPTRLLLLACASNRQRLTNHIIYTTEHHQKFSET